MGPLSLLLLTFLFAPTWALPGGASDFALQANKILSPPPPELCSVERMIGRQYGPEAIICTKLRLVGAEPSCFRGVVHNHGRTEQSSKVARGQARHYSPT